ncbi:hypothetical protein, partial [Sutterella wadsworthensis]|uniref:hypothetical protein n=1 Tax=Sutterella wadsworthensis TaxID=40545 RepID=UPI003967D00D
MEAELCPEAASSPIGWRRTLGFTSDPVRNHSKKKLGASLLRNAPNRLKRKSMALETYFAASA